MTRCFIAVCYHSSRKGRSYALLFQIVYDSLSFLSKNTYGRRRLTFNTYPMAGIFKDMHFNSTTFLGSLVFSSMNPLNIIKCPSVQASFCFQKINMHTSRHIFYYFPVYILKVKSLDSLLKLAFKFPDYNRSKKSRYSNCATAD